MRQPPCAILSGVSAAEGLPAPRVRRRAAPRPELARFLRDRFGPAMYLANIIGALDVYVLLTWVLPTPDRTAHITSRNTVFFVVFLAATGPIGGALSMWQARDVAAWLRR